MGNLATVVLVVMTSKHDVNARNLACKLDVMMNSHMCQSYNVLTVLLFSKFLCVLGGCTLIVLIDDFYLKILERGNPVFLCYTNETYANARSLKNCSPRAAAYALWSVRRPVFLHEVCHDPLAIRMRLHSLLEHSVHLIDSKVEIVVADAGHIYIHGIEAWDHLLTFENGAN